jgi:O-antigen/teichoic acid export membrane protein
MNIKRHTMYNLAGATVPMLVSIATVPAFLRLIGNARFGVLALVWVFLGYFGLFDPGITRAAAFHIARLDSPNDQKEREGVFWTALGVNLAFGVLGGLVVYIIARPFFMYTFKMPEPVRREVLASLPWLAASVAISVASWIFGGALEAREKFGYSNAVTIVTGVSAQLAPLAVAYWQGPDLTWLIPAVVIARMVGVIPNFVGVARTLPLGVGGRFDWGRVKTLFSYGGWVTITNLLTPILTSMDRMLIGSVLNAEAVAFYSVPFNLASRVSVFPAAVSTSLFPKLSRAKAEDSTRLASGALAALGAIMTPILVMGIAILPVFMTVWVGRNFAAHAAPVGIIIIIGIWINCLAYIPFNHLQATNRPDLPAKFHALELLPFLGILWFALHYFGLIGAAWAWTLRVSIDSVLLFGVSGQLFALRRVLPGGMLVLIAALSSPTVVLSIKSAIECLVLIAAIVWSWNFDPVLKSSLGIIVSKFGLIRPHKAQPARTGVLS